MIDANEFQSATDTEIRKTKTDDCKLLIANQLPMVAIAINIIVAIAVPPTLIVIVIGSGKGDNISNDKIEIG